MDLVTVLSPHQDDSAFSLAITICALVNAGHRVRIVNCFTVSNYAPYAAAATSTGEIRQIRRLEDREFVSRIGHGVDVIDLDMLDAPLRLDCSVSAVRRRTMNARDDTDARRIAGVLTRLTGKMLLAPAGLGNHIDHLVAREAGLRVSAAGYPVGFYEDLPYAAESRECC